MKSELIIDFKKRFHLVDKLVRKELSKYPMQMNFKIDQSNIKSTLEMPPDPDLGRLALLIQPFADSESPLFFERIYHQFVSNPHCQLDKNKKVEYQNEFNRVKKGELVLNFNDEVLDGPTIFKLYAYGGYLEERSEETVRLKAIINSFPIMAQQMKYMFFSYCIDVCNVCRSLYLDIRVLEPRIKTKTLLNGIKQTPCIYCKRTDRDFTTEEHIYPESIGNTEIILPEGAVCKACNNGVLSDLDNYFVNHDMISFLKVIYMPINPKTGRYPKAKSKTFSTERKGPRNIVVKPHGISKSKLKKIFPNNNSFSLETVGRQKFDPVYLGRCLYKIGIGVIAYEQGIESCLDNRYDLARKFVLGETSFPNYLFITKNVIPSQEVGAIYQPFLKGTLMSIRIFGIGFAFNLEPEPVLCQPPPYVEEQLQIWPLFPDKSEKKME